MAENDESGFDDHDIVIDRKRSSSMDDGPEAKRFNSNGQEEQVTILIPISVVGPLIGHGGESMRALQTESKCRIDISKGRDLFQDTNERTCTIKGQLSGLMFVMKAILEKIQEKIAPRVPRDYFDLKEFNRENEMKIVISHVSAGPVIGEKGSNIKVIRESTNAQIKVSSADNPQRQTFERVITVAAERNDAILNAIQQILEKLFADSGYARESEKLAAVLRQNRFSTSSNQRNEGRSRSRSSGGSNFGDGGSNYRGDNFSSGNSILAPVMDRNAVDSFLGNLHTTLRGSGFSEMSVHKTMDAIQELVRYNTLCLVLNLGTEAMTQLQNKIPSYYQPPRDVQPVYRHQPRLVPDAAIISDFTGITPARGRYDMPYEY
jgi:predicted RNA-binding protein YlqC (UPF0109 family)